MKIFQGLIVDQSLFNPLTKILVTPLGNHHVESLEITEWLRDNTLNDRHNEVNAYGTLCNHYGRVVTLDEYRDSSPRMFSSNEEIAEFLLMERLGLTADQFDCLKFMFENPDVLKSLAESRMRYMIKDNMCGFNVM